jgi:heme-degrading monooxygenase HmoA
VFVVLFEVQIKSSHWDRYLELAARLRPELVRIPGFIDNERYRSETVDGRLLSLSTWESEKAVVRWRTHAMHHEIQEQGRFEVFADYHLRVGEVTADSATRDLAQTHSEPTESGDAVAVTVTEVAPGEEGPPDPPASPDVVETARYTGITTEGKRVLLVSWAAEEQAAHWVGRQPPGPRQRQVRVVRDYGLRDRGEAPQYFPPVPSVA